MKYCPNKEFLVHLKATNRFKKSMVNMTLPKQYVCYIDEVLLVSFMSGQVWYLSVKAHKIRNNGV